MYKSLILVSNTPIVTQIFNLVCKKLNIKLEVLNEAQIDHKVDIIVIDKEFIDDRFNIFKTYCKQIGAISNDELPFESANDFLIPKPFLPSTLQFILEEQIQIIQKRINSKTYITNIEQPIDDLSIPVSPEPDDESELAVEYLENLASAIASDVKEESDDSIIATASIHDVNGGILDKAELSKLEDIISPKDQFNAKITETYDGTIEEDESDWMDLSSIIDQAIDEVNSTNDLYNKLDNKPIKLLLNNYSMKELTPLLNMLNQEIIDSLTDGQEVTLQLKLGEVNG